MQKYNVEIKIYIYRFYKYPLNMFLVSETQPSQQDV